MNLKPNANYAVAQSKFQIAAYHSFGSTRKEKKHWNDAKKIKGQMKLFGSCNKNTVAESSSQIIQMLVLFCSN